MSSVHRRPNLFCYATKELSLDAMVCWLLAWARRKQETMDKALHACGLQMVKALLGKHRVKLDDVTAVELSKQDHGIDVLARVNHRHVLLIEDKTKTRHHSNQLQRYPKYVRDGQTRFRDVSADCIYPIYLKTGNYQRGERVYVEKTPLESISRPYKFFDRRDILAVLDDYAGSNAILVDYRDYLRKLENDTESYASCRSGGKANWSWASWEGIYRRLEEKLIQDRGNMDVWGYVPKGNFLGFWWNYLLVNGYKDVQAFLQLEVQPDEEKMNLCFRIKVNGKDGVTKRQLREECSKRLLNVGGSLVRRPKHMGTGDTMTVALWAGEWLAFDGNGKFDFNKTAKNLQATECVLRKAFKNWKLPN